MHWKDILPVKNISGWVSLAICVHPTQGKPLLHMQWKWCLLRRWLKLKFSQQTCLFWELFPRHRGDVTNLLIVESSNIWLGLKMRWKRQLECFWLMLTCLINHGTMCKKYNQTRAVGADKKLLTNKTKEGLIRRQLISFRLKIHLLYHRKVVSNRKLTKTNTN